MYLKPNLTKNNDQLIHLLNLFEFTHTTVNFKITYLQIFDNIRLRLPVLLVCAHKIIFYIRLHQITNLYILVYDNTNSFDGSLRALGEREQTPVC